MGKHYATDRELTPAIQRGTRSLHLIQRGLQGRIPERGEAEQQTLLDLANPQP